MKEYRNKSRQHHHDLSLVVGCKSPVKCKQHQKEVAIGAGERACRIEWEIIGNNVGVANYNTALASHYNRCLMWLVVAAVVYMVIVLEKTQTQSH